MFMSIHPVGNGSSAEAGRARPARLLAVLGAAGLTTVALARAAASPAHATGLRGAAVAAPSAAQTQEQIDAQAERSVVQLEIDYPAYVDYPDENGDWYRSSEPVQV